MLLLSIHSLPTFCRLLRNDNNASFTFSRLSFLGSKAPLSICFKSISRNTVTSTLFLIFFAALKFEYFSFSKCQSHRWANGFSPWSSPSSLKSISTPLGARAYSTRGRSIKSLISLKCHSTLLVVFPLTAIKCDL